MPQWHDNPKNYLTKGGVRAWEQQVDTMNKAIANVSQFQREIMLKYIPSMSLACLLLQDLRERT